MYSNRVENFVCYVNWEQCKKLIKLLHDYQVHFTELLDCTTVLGFYWKVANNLELWLVKAVNLTNPKELSFTDNFFQSSTCSSKKIVSKSWKLVLQLSSSMKIDFLVNIGDGIDYHQRFSENVGDLIQVKSFKIQ